MRPGRRRAAIATALFRSPHGRFPPFQVPRSSFLSISLPSCYNPYVRFLSLYCQDLVLLRRRNCFPPGRHSPRGRAALWRRRTPAPRIEQGAYFANDTRILRAPRGAERLSVSPEKVVTADPLTSTARIGLPSGCRNRTRSFPGRLRAGGATSARISPLSARDS